MNCQNGGNCKKLCNNNDCEICFNKSFVSNEKSKYWSEENKIKPRNVFLQSNKKFIFNCDNCSHNFEGLLSNIIKGQWCSYCSNRQLCNNNDCEICFNKSFASNEKSKYWSDKNSNKPRDVFKSSGDKYYFNCNDCNHLIYMSLVNINNNNSWCSYCSNKELCNNKCEICFNKSFASNEKSKYWSNKNKIEPHKVFKNSNNKFYFDCNNCNHTFETQISHITNYNQWCPYCCFPMHLLCKDENCMLCFNNSFASHKNIEYWSEKNKENPRDLSKNSNKKYWFKCKNNHDFDSALNNVNAGYWCPYCLYKRENECKIIFERLLNKPFFKSRQIIKPYELDGYNKDLKLAFEYQGEHHYYYIPYFHKNEETFKIKLERDILKKRLCEEQNIILIEIKYNIKNLEDYIKNKLIKHKFLT